MPMHSIKQVIAEEEAAEEVAPGAGAACTACWKEHRKQDVKNAMFIFIYVFKKKNC